MHLPALDPIAEYEIYRQFNTLVDGKTAIYISHRLSSCRFCDIIYVFVDGEIKERGTHAELAAVEGGHYAKMFAAQAAVCGAAIKTLSWKPWRRRENPCRTILGTASESSISA